MSDGTADGITERRWSSSATSGVHNAHDVLKMLMAGASVTQLCSVLYKHGIDQIKLIERELVHWMEEHEYRERETDAGQPQPKELSGARRFRAGPIHARLVDLQRRLEVVPPRLG